MKIIDSFWDGTGQHRVASPEVRAALMAAVDASSGEATAVHGQGLIIVRQGESRSIDTPGELVLEDGTTRDVQRDLPVDLPLGYHRLQVQGADRSVRVIVCPRQCHADESLYDWGWAVQLYSARSRQSWGIGDLADLRRLAGWSRDLGATLLLLSPLSAVAPVIPQQSSPYYPTSRLFRNPLYLSIDDVPGAAESADAIQHLAKESIGLNQRSVIDRDTVFRNKMAALERIWSNGVDDPRFADYRREQGTPLLQFAIYCVLSETHGGNWREWPSQYEHHRDDAVQQFAEQRMDRVRFHQWLQWLLDQQLCRAAAELSLVHDLPIGFDPGGFDAWIWQDYLADNVSVGAPADGFNPNGQDWGLPPFVPDKLRAVGYQPFIQTLRASFRHAAGLRIDHVMGLFRQFWIPRGWSPADGAYVDFPADELLAILALESHRARAWVVGEDLGTAPEGMRELLAEQKVLSYRLLWFAPNSPDHYPAGAVAAITTHDLPTVAGLWSGADRTEMKALGFVTDKDELDGMRQHFINQTGLSENATSDEAIECAYQLLGKAPSAVLFAALEDALAVERRPNLPGTTDQRPNWSLALPQAIDDIEVSGLPTAIASALNRPAKEFLDE